MMQIQIAMEMTMTMGPVRRWDLGLLMFLFNLDLILSISSFEFREEFFKFAPSTINGSDVNVDYNQCSMPHAPIQPMYIVHVKS